jgi:Flp pilus assembly protein TadD
MDVDVASAVAPPAVSRRRPRLPRLAARAALGLYWLTVAGLIAFNGWWLVRDLTPLPNLKTLEGAVSRKEFGEAERQLREHLRRSPHDGEARLLLGRSLAARDQLLACARELHRVPFWWPRKREALCYEGKSFLDAHHAREAEGAWLACIADDPLHPPPPQFFKAAVEGLLELYSIEGRWIDARKVIWAAYDQAEPEDRGIILITRLRTELERIDPAKAAPRLRQFLAADPTDLDARLALARAEAALGHEAEATRQVQISLRERRDDPRAWREWLAMLEARHDNTSLTAAMDQVPASVLADGDIQEYRGLVAERAGNLPHARDAYRLASNAKPFDGEYLYRLARLEAQLGESDAARRDLERSKALRSARRSLDEALEDYFNAVTPGKPARIDIATATRRLADICRTLGWTREADAVEGKETTR